jgi:hypothetical protein
MRCFEVAVDKPGKPNSWVKPFQCLRHALTLLPITFRYGDVVRTLSEQSSVPVEGQEFAEAVKSLEQEGRVQVVGEGARRSIRRVTGVS